MSVEVEAVAGNDILDIKAETLYSAGVSSQRFYNRVWERGIKETGVKVFQDGLQFDKTQFDTIVCKELRGLHAWAERELTGTDKTYMQKKIEYLLETIPPVFAEREDLVMYIY